MTNCPGKTSWPELLGRNGTAAAAVIEQENSNVDAIVVPVGSPVTQDFRCDRVRVFVAFGVVVLIPSVG
ncbi:proteinase inhibitor [Phtheirospermum japonicum]|uniref:Proteinase inhibitor n=1 Tax=Phtheirospermum japonicum TaxID=374723 RepID=A0A830BBY4_9LAMI|nr:proteinase inhibitor [Phtheirospermum japonicum]